ncbi:MAG: hypothetical protein HQK87_02490 [Nitrospinae bacterium]|nr:hypothetical protein [Nitrospinota bacterium]
MKKYRILMWILFLLVIGFWVYAYALPSVRQSLIKAGLYQGTRETNISLAYVVQRGEEWLTFPFASGTRRLKLVLNASVPEDARYLWDKRWRYTIQVRLYDKDGALLLDRPYVSITNVSVFRTPESPNPVLTSVFGGVDLIPTGGRILYLSDKVLQDAHSVKIRFVEGDPYLQDISVRVYREEILPDRRLAHLWNRIEEEKKEALTDDSVYTHDLLNDWERKMLARRLWTPLGPDGLEGRDYTLRQIHTIKDFEGDEIDLPIEPQGVVAGPRRRAIIPVPNTLQPVKLTFTPFALGQSKPATAYIRWLPEMGGMDPGPVVEAAVDPVKISETWITSVQGGLLEIWGSDNFAVRGYINNEEEGDLTEITPEREFLRGFMLPPKRGIQFKVSNLEGDRTGFRFDVRRFTLPDGGDLKREPVTIRFKTLDAKGALLESGSVAVGPFEPSAYDALSAGFERADVSVPHSFYLLAPPGAVMIALESDDNENLLVAGHNRSYRATRTLTLPDEYFSYERNQLPFNPAWYSILPVDFQSLMMEGYSQALTVQDAPAQMEDALVIWETVAPSNRPVGVMLFVPHHISGSYEDPPSPSRYAPVAQKQERDMVVGVAGENVTLTPSLLFNRQRFEPTRVRVMLDHKLHFEGELIGMQGEFELPKVMSGEHLVQITCDDPEARFYLDSVRPDKTVYTKRMAYSIKEGNILTFPFVKQEGKDSLTVHYHGAGGAVLSAWLEPVRWPTAVVPYDSLTIPNRRFTIKSGGGGAGGHYGPEPGPDAGHLRDPLSPHGKRSSRRKLPTEPGAAKRLQRVCVGDPQQTDGKPANLLHRSRH